MVLIFARKNKNYGSYYKQEWELIGSYFGFFIRLFRRFFAYFGLFGLFSANYGSYIKKMSVVLVTNRNESYLILISTQN